MKHLSWVSLVCLAATLGWANPLPTLELVSSVTTVNSGDTVTLDLNILGLGSAGSVEVGSFDSFIGFDPTLLFPTGASFTLLLGDPSLFEAITAFATGSNWAEATDVSLLSVADLDAMQPSNFTLATYSFVALGPGMVNFTYLGGPVDNGYGDLIAGSKSVVPEPSSLWLLFSGLTGGGLWRLRWRGYRMLGLLAVAVALLASCPLKSFANVDPTWVFCDVDPRKNEKVKYCIKPFAKDAAAWTGFIDDAAKEWSDGTSWKFEKTDDCTKAQVIVQQGAVAGTGDSTPTKRADNKCNKSVTITVRDAPLGGAFWAKDKTGAVGKNNPLNCIKHEMGHSLLLDHSDTKDNNVMWEDNTNVIALSAEDIDEGNTAQDRKVPVEKDTSVTPSTIDQSWYEGDFDIFIPAFTNFSDTIIGILPLSPRSTPSFESNLPAPTDRIIRAASYFTTDFVASDPVDTPIIFTSVVFSPAIYLSLHYTTGDLTDGHNFAHQFQVGEPVGIIDENSLQALVFNGSSWVTVPSTLDKVNQVVTVPVTQLNAIVALAGQTVPCDVNGDGQIDINDINLIIQARNTPSCRLSDPRDVDRDGIITANDARACALRCTYKNCATSP